MKTDLEYPKGTTPHCTWPVRQPMRKAHRPHACACIAWTLLCLHRCGCDTRPRPFPAAYHQRTAFDGPHRCVGNQHYASVPKFLNMSSEWARSVLLLFVFCLSGAQHSHCCSRNSSAELPWKRGPSSFTKQLKLTPNIITLRWSKAFVKVRFLTHHCVARCTVRDTALAAMSRPRDGPRLSDGSFSFSLSLLPRAAGAIVLILLLRRQHLVRPEPTHVAEARGLPRPV